MPPMPCHSVARYMEVMRYDAIRISGKHSPFNFRPVFMRADSTFPWHLMSLACREPAEKPTPDPIVANCPLLPSTGFLCQ